MGRRRSASATTGARRGFGPLFGSAARETPRFDGRPTGPVAVDTPEARTGNMTRRENTGSSAATDAGIANGHLHPHQLPSIRFVAHQDARSSRPSLEFTPISRTLPRSTDVIRVGRYSEKDAAMNAAAGPVNSSPVGFKSKVVSRRHCEFWCTNGQWYIKDVKSSSGTFLNHIRLSQPSVESRPWKVNDGDVIQLGIDFKGGEEMIFRCVKMRVECNRGWQKGLNNFNTTTHQRLRKLASKKPQLEGDAASTHSSECSICLLSIAVRTSVDQRDVDHVMRDLLTLWKKPCQSLFVAPCSHVWHYKCIRPILNGPTWPHFLCPNCRAVSDLDVDIEETVQEWEDELQSGTAQSIREADEDDLSGHHTADSPGSNMQLSIHLTNGDSVHGSDGHGVPEDTGAEAGRFRTSEDRPGMSRQATETAPRERRSSQGSISQALDAVRDASNSDPPRQVIRTSDEVMRCPIDIPHQPAGMLGPEGPLTPRNDIGPFVLDGSGGRSAGRSIEAHLEHTTPTNAEHPVGRVEHAVSGSLDGKGYDVSPSHSG